LPVVGFAEPRIFFVEVDSARVTVTEDIGPQLSVAVDVDTVLDVADQQDVVLVEGSEGYAVITAPRGVPSR
jgi:hypothetical protein